MTSCHCTAGDLAHIYIHTHKVIPLTWPTWIGKRGAWKLGSRTPPCQHSTPWNSEQSWKWSGSFVTGTIQSKCSWSSSCMLGRRSHGRGPSFELRPSKIWGWWVFRATSTVGQIVVACFCIIHSMCSDRLSSPNLPHLCPPVLHEVPGAVPVFRGVHFRVTSPRRQRLNTTVCCWVCCLSIYLSIYLSISVFVYSFICLFIHLFSYLFSYYLFIYLVIDL